MNADAGREGRSRGRENGPIASTGRQKVRCDSISIGLFDGQKRKMMSARDDNAMQILQEQVERQERMSYRKNNNRK